MASKIFVITGPSGVGKGSLVRELCRRVPELELVVPTTTRSKRSIDVEGHDYHFINQDEFERRNRSGDFLEWSVNGSNFTGFLRSDIDERKRKGVPAVLKIRVHGALELMRAIPDSVYIYISPPNAAELLESIEIAGPDKPIAIQAQTRVAQYELKARDNFAHQIINGSFDRAAAELEQLVRRELGLA